MYCWDESTWHLMVGPYQRVLITSYSPSSHDCISGRTGVVHSCLAANWHGFHLIAHPFHRHMHWRCEVPCNFCLSNQNSRQAYLPHDESGKLLGNTPAWLRFKTGVISSACEKIWIDLTWVLARSEKIKILRLLLALFQLAFRPLLCWTAGFCEVWLIPCILHVKI